MNKLVAALLASILVAAPAHAGQSSAAKIFSLYPTEHGIVLFHTYGVRSAVPSCVATAAQNRFAIDIRTDAGRSMYALVLAAWAQGKDVAINGTGTCTTWADSEGVNFVQVGE